LYLADRRGAKGTRRIKQTTAANVFVAGQLQKRNNKIFPQLECEGGKLALR